MNGEATNKAAIMFAMLHDVFSLIEELAAKYDVLFVRTSGSGCLLAAGVPDAQPRHAEALAHLAHDVFGFLHELTNRRFKVIAKEEGVGPSLGMGMRAGLAVGQLQSGFIGFHKFRYDLWGPAVNIADTLQTRADQGELLVSPRARELLARERGTFSIGRGVGVHMPTEHGDEHRDVTAYGVKRVEGRSFVREAQPDDVRYWEEQELDAEATVIGMVKAAEATIWQEFQDVLQTQCRLRLTGKQGVQMDTRRGLANGLRNQLNIRPELSGTAEQLLGYIEAEIAEVHLTHAQELAQVDATLATVPGRFEEKLAHHWNALEQGAFLKGKLRITQALNLNKRDHFGNPAADAYAVFFFNDKRIGQTEVLKGTVNPAWEENAWEFHFMTQITNTLRIEVYEWDVGAEEGRNLLGQIVLVGRGADMLPPELQKETFMPLGPREGRHDPHIGGRLGIEFMQLSNTFTETSAEQDLADVRAAFDEIDEDGGGTLDREELGQLSARLGRPLNEKELNAMMAEIDQDGGGDIDFDEFFDWWEKADGAGGAAGMKAALRAERSSKRTAQRIFEQVDIDGSGDVTFEEFEAWWKARSMASTGRVDKEALADGMRIFHEFDVDGGGSLDPEEFSMMLTQLAQSEWVPASTSGKRYYFNPKTKETRWALPEVGESDELLDMFVEHNVKLELTGEKAHQYLMAQYDQDVRRQMNEISKDSKVRSRILSLLQTKLQLVTQLVDATVEVFDDISDTIDQQVRCPAWRSMPPCWSRLVGAGMQ
jgi:Ca2+-binding EF-hand superfamily protein/class 3 adenylate cyclase